VHFLSCKRNILFKKFVTSTFPSLTRRILKQTRDSSLHILFQSLCLKSLSVSPTLNKIHSWYCEVKLSSNIDFMILCKTLNKSLFNLLAFHVLSRKSTVTSASPCGWFHAPAVIERSPESLRTVQWLFPNKKSVFPFLNNQVIYRRRCRNLGLICLFILNVSGPSSGMAARLQLQVPAHRLLEQSCGSESEDHVNYFHLRTQKKRNDAHY